MEVGEGLLQVEPTRLEEGPLPRVVGLPVPRVEEGGGAVLGEAKLHLLARIAAMELTLLDKLSGTLANAATVALGTGLGLVLRGRLPERMARIMVQGVGLTTLFIGLSMAQALGKAKGGAVDGVVLGLVALVLGGFSGSGLGWRRASRASGRGSSGRCGAGEASPRASWRQASSSAWGP